MLFKHEFRNELREMHNSDDFDDVKFFIKHLYCFLMPFKPSLKSTTAVVLRLSVPFLLTIFIFLFAETVVADLARTATTPG